MEVHRCNIVDYVPKTINSIEFTPKTWKIRPYLAVGRSNGDIEIWTYENGYSLEKTIPGYRAGTLETLVWAHQVELSEEDKELYSSEEEQKQATRELLETPPRLFTAGTKGEIVEWDLRRLRAKKKMDSYGGAVWSMAVNNKQTELAVGTDEGSIRIFDITEGGIRYKKGLEGATGTKILSICWTEDDQHIVAGSDDGNIRKWKVAEGRIVSKLTTKTKRSEKSMIWSVVVIKGTRYIASGDSTGSVIFWDIEMEIMVQKIQSHLADILCMGYDESSEALYVSGVDHKLSQFKKVKGIDQWVEKFSKRTHTHDVRAIGIENGNGGRVVTGGVDGRMMVNCEEDNGKFNSTRMPVFPPQNEFISVSKRPDSKGRVIMTMKNHEELKIWKVKVTNDVGEQQAQQLLANHRQQNSACTEKVIVKIDGKSNLVATGVSPSGKYIVVSDTEKVRLFEVLENNENDELVIVKRVDNLLVGRREDKEYVTKIHFAGTDGNENSGEEMIVLATSELNIYVIQNLASISVNNTEGINEKMDNTTGEAASSGNNELVYKKIESHHDEIRKEFTVIGQQRVGGAGSIIGKLRNITGLSAFGESRYLVSIDSGNRIAITDLKTNALVFYSSHTNVVDEGRGGDDGENNTGVIYPINVNTIVNNNLVSLILGYNNNTISVLALAMASANKSKKSHEDAAKLKLKQNFGSILEIKEKYPINKILTSNGSVYVYGVNYIYKVDITSLLADATTAGKSAVNNGLENVTIKNIDENNKHVNKIINQSIEHYNLFLTNNSNKVNLLKRKISTLLKKTNDKDNDLEYLTSQTLKKIRILGCDIDQSIAIPAKTSSNDVSESSQASNLTYKAEIGKGNVVFVTKKYNSIMFVDFIQNSSASSSSNDKPVLFMVQRYWFDTLSALPKSFEGHKKFNR